MDQRAKAKRFLELHTSGRLLVLPNAWDAGSANASSSGELVPARGADLPEKLQHSSGRRSLLELGKGTDALQ